MLPPALFTVAPAARRSRTARHLWSTLMVSTAVSAASLLGMSRNSGAQETAPAAPAAATAPEAPAAAPAASAVDQDTQLANWADDVLHYSIVNNIELAKANADQLADAKVPPEAIVKAFESIANGRDFRDVLIADQRRPELKDSAAKLLDVIDQGFRNVARDPVRIRADIDRLATGPRAYSNAKDRLTAAGQYAVPIFLEYLQNNSKKELHPFIIRVMGEIGRPLLNPLIEELRVSDPTLRVELITVVGQIGYPQSLPVLRAMQSDNSATPDLKAAIDTAINLIDRSGQASKMSSADLYLAGAENYYNKKASYMPPLPDEKTNPVWYFDQALNNVTPIQVPTAIWNCVMSLRMTEATLKADPSNSNAISLWLAATLKKEILLPTGAVDPSKSPSEQDGLFYARASGPLYLNPVLGRALDDHDSMLALHTISALEATGGVTGLVNGADSPLVRALSYPDRSVRFAATFALARANPVSQFPSFFRIVPILAEAVNTTSAPSALLITSNANLRNHFSDLLHNGDAHYTVYAGETLSDALEQARRAPAFDVVVVPNGPDVGRVSDLSRSDYRLTGIPMLVMSPTDNMNDIKMQQAANKGVAVIDEAADAPAISAALDKIRADVSAVAVSPENASS
ncbi:MAG TPA: HEAT repeat domain-containing protein, partial [Phycisphaerae bacterium]